MQDNLNRPDKHARHKPSHTCCIGNGDGDRVPREQAHTLGSHREEALPEWRLDRARI